jgi:hypothetical protein
MSVEWHPSAPRRSRTSVAVSGLLECQFGPSGGLTTTSYPAPVLATLLPIRRTISGAVAATLIDVQQPGWVSPPDRIGRTQRWLGS